MLSKHSGTAAAIVVKCGSMTVVKEQGRLWGQGRVGWSCDLGQGDAVEAGRAERNSLKQLLHRGTAVAKMTACYWQQVEWDDREGAGREEVVRLPPSTREAV